MKDIVAEWSKAPDLGSGLRWRRFESCRCHFCLVENGIIFLVVAVENLCVICFFEARSQQNIFCYARRTKIYNSRTVNEKKL